LHYSNSTPRRRASCFRGIDPFDRLRASGEAFGGQIAEGPAAVAAVGVVVVVGGNVSI